jgi:hypothetical protein
MTEQKIPEENLKRLSESDILLDFVKRHNAEWDHSA